MAMNNPSMLQKIGGAIGAVLITAAQLIVRKLYPLPAGTHFEDTESIAAYIQGLPAGALGGMLSSYFLACLLGGLAASKISGGTRGAIYTTGALLLATSTLNQMTIPHPTWFSASTPLMFIAATALTIQLTNAGRKSQ
jgi:hypothetical protein